MKSKELIRRLQEQDPTGEVEVCVRGEDVHTVERIPAYYDGPFQVLIRDPEKAPYYNVVGMRFRRNTGEKVVVKTLGYASVVFMNPDATLDVSDLDQERQEEVRRTWEGWAEKSRQHTRELHWEYFREFVGESLGTTWGELRLKPRVEAKKFFDAHIDPFAPFPEGVPREGKSFEERRKEQWKREWDVRREGEGLAIAARPSSS